ncbi:MAG: helix-turn-helix transcriptional regulator [Clostridiales bacterium]|jgi:transcriptional regulator with XRE-family HTH domain|nr:helix-turn-helix transcriptional regulator [Clostridiales bacterium]
MSQHDAHTDFYTALGRALSQARESRGYTQAQFARALGIAQSTYGGYEAALRKIPVHVLKQAADKLNVSVDGLLK